MPASDDLTVITGLVEQYATTSSSTPTGYYKTYYHIPFFAYEVIAIVVSILFSRFLLELIIRLRK